MLLILNRKKELLAGKECWTEDGSYISSSDKTTGIDINGLNKEAGIARMIQWLELKDIGKAKVNYKLRDWLFSRQRYWGEPFPVIHWEDGEITLADENELPVELPEMEKYLPGETGESPLANASEWLTVTDKMAAEEDGRPTLCRSGQDRAGITSGISILTMTDRFLIWKKSNTGCRSISISVEQNMPFCIFFTAVSGIRYFLTLGL